MTFGKLEKQTDSETATSKIAGLSYFLGHIAGILEKRELPGYLIDIVNQIGQDYIEKIGQDYIESLEEAKEVKK